MSERCVAALCNNVNDQENNIGLHRRFLNLRHRHQSRGHFEHVIFVISSRGRPQENRILNFVKIRKKKIAFYPNRKFFSQKFIRWNVELDERKKHFDIMGTLSKLTFPNFFSDWPNRYRAIARLWRKLSVEQRDPYRVSLYYTSWNLFVKKSSISWVSEGRTMIFLRGSWAISQNNSCAVKTTKKTILARGAMTKKKTNNQPSK